VSAPTYVVRPGHYRRKADGRTVIAADWTDGDVSWILDPMPVIASALVGTCSAEHFRRRFEPALAQEKPE
jgi:hypothetical protein